MSIVLALIGLFVFPLLGVALFHYVRDVLRWYGTGDPHPRVAWLAVGAGMVACLVVAAVWVAWTVVPVTWEPFWRWLAIVVLSSVFLFEALFVAWGMCGLQGYADSMQETDASGPDASN